ncbi:MAG: hypothetical protein GX962_02495 [Epulopiscium sp.]|nr:hypothetical protein [Candidatus Epulonipiscium sp.]
MNKFKNLTPADVLERKGNIPSLSIVGASGSGKTTVVTNLLNPKIALYTSVGIGEKSQTTTFASNFILDARIDQEDIFAISIKSKKLDSKLIAGKIFEAVVDEFLDNGYEVENTIESLKDDDWTDIFLEPKDASYHLSSIKNKLDIEKLIALIESVLKNFDEEDFEQKVAERKKILGKKTSKEKKLKRTVLLSYALDPSVIEWVENIEEIIVKELEEIIGEVNPFNKTFSYVVESTGKDILKEIYNPQKSYSLVIDNIDIACKPRDEAVKIMKQKDSDIPLRMMLVDTVGVSQEGVDEDSLTMGVDRALNRSVNAIILIINLEEREDVIKNIFDSLNKKFNELQNKSDVYILFSKGDKLVETKIDKRKMSLKISQEDYNREIKTVLEEISEIIERYSKGVYSNVIGVRWQSLSYKDENIDPRILAIKSSTEFSEEEKIENRDYVNSSQNERELLKNKYLELINDKLDWIGGQILNQVSMRASYENEYIKSQIDKIYFNSEISYTETFKQMQSKYREIFASEEFKKILCDEISIVISNAINSGFVVI